MFFALEGLDGVGKSSVADRLVRNLNVSLYSPSIEKIGGISLANNSKEVHFLYYLFANYLVGKKAAAQDKIAIADSHVLRTLSAHEAMGINPFMFSILAPIIKQILKPDLTFLLICPHSERIRRLCTRTRDIDEFDITEETKGKMIMGNYHKWSKILAYDLITIDTTNGNIDGIAESITAAILANRE